LCGALIIPGISYGSLTRTPWQGEGPFYPDIIPEDTDNDLVKNGDTLVEAGGKILILNCILVNLDSQPVKGVSIEIWQTDKNGVYLHSGSFARDIMDKKFQGFGRTKTDRNVRGSSRIFSWNYGTEETPAISVCFSPPESLKFFVHDIPGK
jgi:protocatechuate 3,4-dioxygenase beta subunit